MKLSDALSLLALSGSFVLSETNEEKSIDSGFIDLSQIGTSDASIFHKTPSIAYLLGINSIPATQAPTDKDTCHVAERPQSIDVRPDRPDTGKIGQIGQIICPLVCTQKEGVLPDGTRYRLTMHDVPDQACVIEGLKKEGATAEPSPGSDWTEWMEIMALVIGNSILLAGTIVLFHEMTMFLLMPRRQMIRIDLRDSNGNCPCQECRQWRGEQVNNT